MATRRRQSRREPKQARSREMVERIVAAGQAVLLDKGYDGVTTNHIAAAAGISPGSLYQYFPDKEAILTEVLERYTEGLRARISRAFLGTLTRPSVADSVRDNLNALLDAFSERADLLRVLVRQMPLSADNRHLAFRHQVDDLVVAALSSLPGVPDDRPLDAIAWVLVRTVEHATTSYVLERPPIARDAVVDELTALITGYLWSRLRVADARP